MAVERQGKNRGPSECSLLNIIGTIDKPSSGDVYLFGEKVDFKGNEEKLAKIRLNQVKSKELYELDWLCIPNV